MVTPHIFPIGSQVCCQGRPAYIITIQRGTRHDSGQQEGIYYGVSHIENARKPSFIVHNSQVWEMSANVEAEAQKISLVKA